VDTSPQPADAEPQHDDVAASPQPYVIVLGNEKGGTGKSTTAMHLAVALLKCDFAVGTIDLDSRQATLSRYLENRAQTIAAGRDDLSMPRHHRLQRSSRSNRAAAAAEETERLTAALGEPGDLDFIVMDTPGSDSHLSRLAHEHADTLITPLNDSFLDLYVLAVIDHERRQVVAPSVYSQMVWEQDNRRTLSGKAPIDWVVMRNRLSHIDARNKRDVGALLELLAKRIGFRLVPGFGERVIFRELFVRGLTLLDSPSPTHGAAPKPSHLAAYGEIAMLLRAIGLPEEVLRPAVPLPMDLPGGLRDDD